MEGGLRAWKRVMTPGSISAILPFAETSLSRTAANTLMTAAPSASSVGVDSMKKERRGGRGGGEEREEVFGGGRGFKVYFGRKERRRVRDKRSDITGPSALPPTSQCSDSLAAS